MDWLTGIQNAVNYVEEHLTEEIDYDKVAREAACSSFYFQRIFGILCGISLGDYIRNRRLTLAGHELCASDHKVIDIALKYGYESPESLDKSPQRRHGEEAAGGNQRQDLYLWGLLRQPAGKRKDL